MLNSLTENKSVWYTDFSRQETIFYISWQNCKIFVLAEDFSAGDLKILSVGRQPGGTCYYYHLYSTDGKLNARKIKNLTENKGTCQRSVRKGKTADPILFQSAMVASDLSQISHPVSLTSLCICKQSVHGYYLWKLSHKGFAKRSKSTQIV